MELAVEEAHKIMNEEIEVKSYDSISKILDEIDTEE